MFVSNVDVLLAFVKITLLHQLTTQGGAQCNVNNPTF